MWRDKCFGGLIISKLGPAEEPVKYKVSLVQIKVTSTDVLGILARHKQGHLLKMLAEFSVPSQLPSDNPYPA